MTGAAGKRAALSGAGALLLLAGLGAAGVGSGRFPATGAGPDPAAACSSCDARHQHRSPRAAPTAPAAVAGPGETLK